MGYIKLALLRTFWDQWTLIGTMKPNLLENQRFSATNWLNTFGKVSHDAFGLKLVLVPMIVLGIISIGHSGTGLEYFWFWSQPLMLRERFVFVVIEFDLESLVNLILWLQ